MSALPAAEDDDREDAAAAAAAGGGVALVDAGLDFRVIKHDPARRRRNSGTGPDPDAFLLSEEGVLIDLDEEYCYANYRVKQYVESVVDFSSQYGSQYSISYTATNIIGRPTKYPEYGDFPETFAMRTYGDWWSRAPSRIREIQPQNLSKTPVQDFIVVGFEEYIIPEEIAIFETFNPGAVVRIWAHTITKSWLCLWEAKDFNERTPYTRQRVRRFAPPLRKCQLPTKTLRLEFNHKHLNYFTEIDAILLSGRSMSLRSLQQYTELHERQQLRRKSSSIVRKLQHMQFRPDFRDNYQNSLHDFFVNDLNKFIEVLANPGTMAAEGNELAAATSANDHEPTARKVGLKDLPFEIILNIFGYLDLISLFRVGQVCRYLYDVSTHPLLYSELSLKPYWHLASNELLCTLAKRATVLRQLDLSWCGLSNAISPTEFKKFMQQRGDSLTHLRLNSCKFLNVSCIETLGIACDNLKELSLRNYSTDPPLLNFSCLANLKNLERLDLFQTIIESDLLLTMLEGNRKLKHLNLAFSGVGVNMDEVAQQIGAYNQQLISLDMWKSPFLTMVGLQALSQCHQLEELDLGWCLREASLGDSLKNLITNCRKLKKLFLATVRGITDSDVQHIANHCKHLEQLDLMGVMGIAKERYYELLSKCQRLQLLDLSFCDNIEDYEISRWMRTFGVSIKCSHLPIPVDTARH